TAAASSFAAPADTALATASCNAVSDSDGRPTLPVAYVRPLPSRTAAPSTAPMRPLAALASVTSLASSAASGPFGCPVSSGTGGLPLLVSVRDHRSLVVGDPAHQYRIDPVSAPGRTLGDQPQPGHVGAGARDRHPAQGLREQAGHGLHLVGRQLGLEQLAQVL